MNSTETAMRAGARVRRVAIASCVGTTIEYYDFLIYGTAAALVFPKVFFPALGSTAGTVASFATFAVAFLARPLGSLGFGHYGDRFGRKRTLIATLLLMGVSTVLIGLLPGAATIGALAPILLIALRVGQGLATGGEWPGATVLTAEYAPPDQRGRYALFPQVGPAIAVGLSSATFLSTSLILGDTDRTFLDYGWRIPFLASIVLVAVGLYVRLKIDETPVFQAAQRQPPARHVPLREVLTQAPRNILLAAGVATMMPALFYTSTVYLTSYGTSPSGAALSRPLVLSFGIVTAATMLLATAVSAILSDRFGRRALTVMSCAGSAVWSLLLFVLLDSHTVLGFAASMILTVGIASLSYGPMGAWLPETFPTRYRYTGAGLSYSLGAIVGAGVPPLVAAPLVAAFGNVAISILLCGLSLLSLVCAGALAETKGRELGQVLVGAQGG